MTAKKVILWEKIDIWLGSNEQTACLREILVQHVFFELMQWCSKWKVILKSTENHWSPNRYYPYRENNSQSLVSHPIEIFLLPAKYRKILQEVCAQDKNSMLQEKHSSYAKLLQVLQRPNSFSYYLDQAQNCKDFKDKVLEDLKKYISSLFQERISFLWKMPLTTWQRKQKRHEFFAISNSTSSLKREKLHHKIFKFLDSKEKIFTIYGEKGCGKSTLLAQFYSLFTQTNSYQKNDVICIAHFAQICTPAPDLNSFLIQLCSELSHALKYKVDIVPKTHHLLKTFKNILENTNKTIIFIFDALDQLEPQIQNFHWFPASLHANVKIIISGFTPTKIKAKYIRKCAFPPLLKGESWEIAKNISLPRPINLWLEEKQMANPFCLTLALKIINSNALRDEKVLMLACPGCAPVIAIEMPETGETVSLDIDTAKLFDILLILLEHEHTKKVVEMLFSLLYCSKEGLTTKELKELLWEIDEEHKYQMLLNQIKEYLIFDEELIAIGNTEFATAIGKKYAPQEYHSFLAQYFEAQSLWSNQEPNLRKLEKLPEQLFLAEDYQGFVKTLMCLEFLENAVENNMLKRVLHYFEKVIDALENNFYYKTEEMEIDKNILRWLRYILYKNFSFLQKYPQELFSIFWNYGYWHDAKKTKKFYQAPGPWDQKKPKLSSLVEHWRLQKKSKKAIWLKSLRPLPQRLDSPLVQQFRGHSDALTGLAICPQGEKIVSMSRDRTLNLWTITGELVYTRDAYYAEYICFSPGGKLIAIGDFLGTISIWDVQSGAKIWEKSYASGITNIKFSPHGNLVVSNSKGHIRFLKPGMKNAFLKINTRYKDLLDIAISPCGRFIACCFLSQVQIWDIAKKECICNLTQDTSENPEHPSSKLSAIDFSSDGQKLLWGQADKIQIWDIKEKKCSMLHPITSKETLNWIFCSFSHNAEFIAFAIENKVEVWDAIHFKHLYTFTNASQIRGMCFSPNSKFVITASIDRAIRIWNISYPREQYYLGAKTNIQQIQYADNIVSCTSLDGLTCYNLQGHPVSEFKNTSKSIKTAHTHDKNLFVLSQNPDETIATLNLFTLDRKKWKLIKSIANLSPKAGICISPNRNILAGATPQGSLSLWDIKAKNNFYQSVCEETAIAPISFSPDSSKILYITEGEVLVWDLSNSKLYRNYFFPLYCTCFCWNNDSSIIAVGGGKEVTIWDINKNHDLCKIKTQNYVNQMCFSPNGKEIAIASNQDIEVWDVEDSNYIRGYQGSGDLNSIVDLQYLYLLLMEKDIAKIVRKKDNKLIASFPAPIIKKIPSKNKIIGHQDTDFYMFELVGSESSLS